MTTKSTTTRDAALLALRPAIDTAPGTLPAEAFQNETLRPILKLQHPALARAWHRYAARQKGTFYRLNRPEQRDYLAHALQTNRALREFVLGLVCGMFTEAEWTRFSESEGELARRALSMALERLLGEDSTYLRPGE